MYTRLFNRAVVESPKPVRNDITRQQLDMWRNHVIAFSSPPEHMLDDRRYIKIVADRVARLRQNEFYRLFNEAPQDLIMPLIDDINRAIAVYENDHPTGQGFFVVSCIGDIQRDINSIRCSQPANIKDYQNLYFALVGSIWFHFNKTNDEFHQPFKAVLEDLLNEHPLNANDSLIEYDAFRNRVSDQFPDRLVNQYISDLNQAFERAHDALQYCLSHQPLDKRDAPHISKAFDVLISVKALREEKNKASPLDFDAKYYTTVLSMTKAIVENPADSKLQIEYRKLIVHCEDGKSSTGVLVAGAMTGLLGAIVFSASVALKIASIGLAAPITTVGIIGGGLMMGIGGVLYYGGKEAGPKRSMRLFSAATSEMQPATEKTPLLALGRVL